MKSYINFIKESTDWNKILYDATWSHEEIGEDIWYMDLDKIKLSIENGADPDSAGTLDWSVSMNNYPIVKYMLENGANVNYQNQDCKWTPLMTAIGNPDDLMNDDSIKIAKLLIDYGADPLIGNFQDISAMDLLLGKSLKARNKKIQKQRDKVYSYIIQNIVEKDPGLSPKYIDYLTPEQKEKYKAYISADNYNL